MDESATDIAVLFGHGGDAPPPDSLAQAAKLYLSARTDKEEVEKELRTRQDTLNNAEEILLAKFEEAGILSIKLDNGEGKPVLLYSAPSAYYAAPSGSLENPEFFLWLLRSGGQDLVKRNIHHASFSSFCRELVEQGKRVHKDVIKTDKKRIGLRSG